MLAANGASISPESQVSLPRFTETLAEEYTPRGPALWKNLTSAIDRGDDVWNEKFMGTDLKISPSQYYYALVKSSLQTIPNI